MILYLKDSFWKNPAMRKENGEKLKKKIGKTVDEDLWTIKNRKKF